MVRREYENLRMRKMKSILRKGIKVVNGIFTILRCAVPCLTLSFPCIAKIQMIVFA
jgi:hypothetical protein